MRNERQSIQILRNRKLGIAAFRTHAEKVSTAVLHKLWMQLKNEGVRKEDVILVIILRSAVAMLSPALTEFPSAPVGVLGLRRDERTKRAHWYYEKLPPLSKKNTIVILDPMLATGGSAVAATRRLILRGADPKQVYFAGIIAAPPGVERLAARIPEGHIIIATLDEGLDEHAMIVPGLGDFGDRYFANVPTKERI